jgi:hypothetical protein
MVQVILHVQFSVFDAYILGSLGDQRQHVYVIAVGFAGPQSAFVVQVDFDVFGFDCSQTWTWNSTPFTHDLLNVFDCACLHLFIVHILCANFFQIGAIVYWHAL